MDTLEDLEIIAGRVWNAVGGADTGSVSVEQVDPKRFGVEVAAATIPQWKTANEGDTVQAVLATLRPFKPMDMMIVDLLNGVLATGLTVVQGIDIGGVQQFTSNNPVHSAVFNVGGAPRPKIRFDTVQTSPNAVISMASISETIPSSDTITSYVAFAGVAVKR